MSHCDVTISITDYVFDCCVDNQQCQKKINPLELIIFRNSSQGTSYF